LGIHTVAEPTLRDFQFLVQLLDSGLVQASVNFSAIRNLLKSLPSFPGVPSVLTPEVEAALAQVEANPALLNIGVNTLKEALSKYPLDTPISVAFGTGGGTTTPTAPVTGAITLTPTQLQDAYKALAGIAATSSKALSEFLTGPNGEKVTNAFFNEMKELAALQADVTAGKVTKAAFIDKLVAYSADTSALALQATNFFTGKTPTQAGLAELIDSAANTTDLTDFAYAKYSTENKYIEFAVNQAMSGAGAAAFKTAYDSLAFRDAVAKMYDAIIGNAKAAAAGINVSAAIDYIVGKQAYFTAYGHDALGAKAAAAGFLMAKGLESNVGLYAEATKAFLTKAYDGQAAYGGDLLAKALIAEVEVVGQAPAHVDGIA
jgi:hypothetical protein